VSECDFNSGLPITVQHVQSATTYVKMLLSDERLRIRKRVVVADLRLSFQHCTGSGRFSSFRIAR